jgi:hypothetical protein
MEGKREKAMGRKARPTSHEAKEAVSERQLDVEAALRSLGVRVADAKRIAGEVCAALPEATLERTVFAACQRLGAPVRAA